MIGLNRRDYKNLAMKKLFSLVLLAVLFLAVPSWAARGFGTTLGSGTTDQILTGLTSNTNQTSWGIWVWQVGTATGVPSKMFNKNNYEFYTDGANPPTFWEFDQEFALGVTPGNWTIAIPSNGAWHRVIITYDRSSVLNNPVIYVDKTSVTVTQIAVPVGTADTDATAYSIGNRADALRNWDGKLAQFTVWPNRLLTQTDVNNDFDNGPQSLGYTLAGYWPLCGTASPEPDLSGNGNNGTVTGTKFQPNPSTPMPCGGFSKRKKLEAMGVEE